jgi:hypothetical protein
MPILVIEGEPTPTGLAAACEQAEAERYEVVQVLTWSDGKWPFLVRRKAGRPVKATGGKETR